MDSLDPIRVVVHLAGDLIAGEQRCLRCEELLATEGLGHWPVHAFVGETWRGARRTNPRGLFVLRREELEADEAFCREQGNEVNDDEALPS